MEVFRICGEKYSRSLIPSGIANRWNDRGQKVVYAGSSRSLATLEMVVHRIALIPTQTYKVLVISIPDDDRFVKQVRASNLPDNWRTLAAYPSLQKIGSDWYKKRETLLLKVPSAVIPLEHNFIINTEHPDYEAAIKLVRAEDCFWDERLI